MKAPMIFGVPFEGVTEKDHGWDWEVRIGFLCFRLRAVDGGPTYEWLAHAVHVKTGSSESAEIAIEEMEDLVEVPLKNLAIALDKVRG